ncbi:MAG: hypothetical protein ABIH21_02195 [Patescibacteria group bacterium]
MNERYRPGQPEDFKFKPNPDFQKSQSGDKVVDFNYDDQTNKDESNPHAITEPINLNELDAQPNAVTEPVKIDKKEIDKGRLLTEEEFMDQITPDLNSRLKSLNIGANILRGKEKEFYLLAESQIGDKYSPSEKLKILEKNKGTAMELLYKVYKDLYERNWARARKTIEPLYFKAKEYFEYNKESMGSMRLSIDEALGIMESTLVEQTPEELKEASDKMYRQEERNDQAHGSKNAA